MDTIFLHIWYTQAYIYVFSFFFVDIGVNWGKFLVETYFRSRIALFQMKWSPARDARSSKSE